MLPLVKDDGPSIDDVHVDGAGKGARTAADIEAERKASLRSSEGAVNKGFEAFFKVASVDEDLGIVVGWGIVCKDWDPKKNASVDYWDVQENHAPEAAMVKATTRFMKDSRMAGEQHERMDAGTIVHSFPLTGDIWKAMFSSEDGQMMGSLPESPPKSGWMIACAPDATMLKAFKDGTLTGFSIGGAHVSLDGKPIDEVA